MKNDEGDSEEEEVFPWRFLCVFHFSEKMGSQNSMFFSLVLMEGRR